MTKRSAERAACSERHRTHCSPKTASCTQRLTGPIRAAKESVAVAIRGMTLLFLAAMFTALLADSVLAQRDAQSILQTAVDRQIERWTGVNDYTITVAVEDVGGFQTPMYYRRMEVNGRPMFRLVSPSEYNREMTIKAGFPPPEATAAGMSFGLELLSDADLGGGMSFGDVSIPVGDGSMSLMDMQTFLAAAHDPNAVTDSKDNARAKVAGMAAIAKRARLIGTESVQATSESRARTTEAYMIIAEDLSDIELDQPDNGATFTLHKMSLWIDAEHYVPRRLLMEGEIENDGQRSPLTIERLDLDYKQAGPLYESHTQIGTLGGLLAGMSEKERKEIEKARQELAKLRKQLDEMPESQKAMVMRMMGPQMEKVEQMAAGGEISSTMRVVSIAINEGPPTPSGLGSLSINQSGETGAATTAGESDDGAVLSISRGPVFGVATIHLVGDQPWPDEGVSVSVVQASGSVTRGEKELRIDGGSGQITVQERTPTRIHGVYNANLTANDGEQPVTLVVEGTFDSSTPTGPLQTPMGSPFQVMQTSP